jgi:hypothetical protein
MRPVDQQKSYPKKNRYEYFGSDQQPGAFLLKKHNCQDQEYQVDQAEPDD